MASSLRTAAVAAGNKGQPSSFYSKDKNNPVIQALNKDVKLYIAYMKKRTTQDNKGPAEDSASRAYEMLFDLWNKYERKLPPEIYEEKLLEIGDFLVSVKEYNLALWQCYDRYLSFFGAMRLEDITDVKTFKNTFFKQGFAATNVGFTFRALMGKCTTMYQAVKASDPKLQNNQSIERCLQILTFFRMLLQVILPKESLCWLVYNGTIHIYSISRHLMSYGHCSKVLEFLLWSSICMETSVPLLSVKYLPWRTTLYTAVCQCYYDCKAGSNAESFARRGLSKINELSQLENMSTGAEHPQNELIFREATIKMAIMVYKRSVFETRRKPKNVLRPKTRANLKDAQGLPWPRTPTEKLLSDMFEGSAAQFLCILESLNDSGRRTLVTGAPAPDTDPEILDVYAELLMAGQEILSGGGGTYGAPKPGNVAGVTAMRGINNNNSLLAMATLGEDGVPLSAAVRLVKLAYSFEQWEAFDFLVDKVLTYIKMLNDNRYAGDEKALEILLAMEKLHASRRTKRQMSAMEETSVLNQDALPPPPSQLGGTSTRSLSQSCDDLMLLADVLLSVVTGKFTPESFDVDMVVDAGLFLWKKCKMMFEKYQTGSADNAKYLQKMEHPNKWVYILDIVHQVLCWCGISCVDPALTAEVVLRLALVLESAAQQDAIEGKKKYKAESMRGQGSTRDMFADSRSQMKESMTDMGVSAGELATHTVASHLSLQSISILSQGVREQLLQARDILELGLEHVARARQAVARSDGKSIADISWAKDGVVLFSSETESLSDIEEKSTLPPESGAEVKVKDDLNRDLFTPESVQTEVEIRISSEAEEAKSEEEIEIDVAALNQSAPATALWNTIKDLHLELLLLYHRVCLKLAALGPDPALKIQKPYRRKCTKIRVGSSQQLAGNYVETVEELTSRCNKSLISKALLNMQRALVSKAESTSPGEQRKLLEETVSLITKAQADEKRLYVDNTIDWSAPPKVTKVPPPPILMSRTNTQMVFRPAPFEPASGEKVAWYTLFGKSSSGSNVKVRLADCVLPGTGEQVPSFECEFCVSGLTVNERYVFAVAAYTQDGKMIGDSVGAMCRPVLASHPLPILMTWAFLTQIAYQVGCHDIAQQACGVLWDHFVAPPPEPEGDTYTTRVQNDYRLTLYKLNKKVVTLSSPVLLRQTMASIFISVDICVRKGELFPDVLCSSGPLYPGQIDRLHQCEKILFGLELAGWLNEANLALQGVVQCYGLLAPFLFYKIPCLAVMQILEFCHAVLQEIPAGLRQKRQVTIADSLHHMTACITYYLAKVLRTLGQKTLASNLNEAGRKLLSADSSDQTDQKPAGEPSPNQKDKSDSVDTKNGEISTTVKSVIPKKKPKKKYQSPVKEEAEGPVNEELKALEAHMMSMSKQSQGEHELTGYEDPNVLHAYISFLPSKIVFKELVKFKRRARYLEFLVRLVQKALSEGQPEMALDWCEDALQWIAKRNEQILGSRMLFTKPVGAPTVTGEDPKKFAAAMVEYPKDKSKAVDGSPRHKATQPARQPIVRASKRKKYKAISVLPNMSETARQVQEEAELKALDVLNVHFPDMYRTFVRRRRLRKVVMEEMPYLVQMNILQGMSQFNALLQKLEKREKVLGSAANKVYRTSFLDQEWFTLETAGTLVVGWEGGPRAPLDRSSDHSMLAALDLADRLETKATGIEIAAAAATGQAPTTLNVIAEALFEDTPRTYRSDIGPYKHDHKQSKSQEPVVSTLSTKVTMENLEKTFLFFTRAVVLAHRGRHWTLLQNTCRALWNCVHTSMLRACTPKASSQDAGLVTMDMLKWLIWQPLCCATQCLLEMIEDLQIDLESQAAKAKSKGHNLGQYFESWMGTVPMEKGAASLMFESPLDDIGVVDIRWVRRLTLRTLEVLYHEQKWERLADIALRFTEISKNRYAEQVLPLLVQAQRNLAEQISLAGGPKPVQPHFARLKRQLGGVITAKDYVKCQLKLDLKRPKFRAAKSSQPVSVAAASSYTELDGCRLVSVPLDVMGSLESLRASLDQSNYTGRALQHSRKLLILYLAGQQNVESGATRETSHVDFASNPDQPQPVMPPELKGEEFRHIGDTQTSPLPKSQLATVISSYDKTIAILLAKNQKGPAAQAVHELGNLHYHAGNIRAAYKWWSEGLDLVLSLPDSLHTWRETLDQKGETSSGLLKRCGLWGCVLAGILASKIAQYVITSDLGLRMECCFLSGYLFKALFCSSLPHPTADRDYALYEVGEGCEVTSLVPGIDLLSDKFRADGRQLVAALRWVTEELARGRYNLFVLPLLTLNQYLTTYVCRDLQRSVDGRILKVRVLTDTGLLLEAFITLQRLLQGERLPHTGDSHFRQVESKLSTHRFNTSKAITDPANIRVLEATLEKRLSSNLATLYGPHMTCHLLLAQAHLLVTIADNIPVLPYIDNPPDDPAKMQSMGSVSQTSKGPLHAASTTKGGVNHSSMAAMPSVKRGVTMSTSGGSPEKEGEKSSENEGVRLAKRLTESKEPVTMEVIKGTMLGVADQMVTSLSDVLVEAAQFDQGVERLAAAELELVVLCRLEQAAIAIQKHHAPMAARVVLSAMKMMQNSELFKTIIEPPPPPRYDDMVKESPSSLKSKSGSGHGKLHEVTVTEADNSQFTYQNFQSRSRLDARLWLQCRLMLVRSLLTEIRGLGDVRGSENKVVTDLADCRQYCAEGVAEAEACGDTEMQAEFFLQGAVLNIMEGKRLENTLLILQDIKKLLENMFHLSLSGDHLLSVTLMLQADLKGASNPPGTSDPNTLLNSYLTCQDNILKQMEDLGEGIEHYYPVGERRHFSSVECPIQNIYLPHMLRLAQVKLRLGYTLARRIALSPSDSSYEAERQWSECLGVLMTALELSQVSLNRQAPLEAEILLNMGKVQRQLVMLGRYQPRAAVNTLLQAIKTTYTNEHDLGLIRQCYLEIALVYLYSSGLIGRQVSTADIQSDSEGEGSLASRPSSQRRSGRRWKSKKERLGGKTKEDIGDTEKERRAAWLAIRCAASVAQAQRLRSLLTGDTAVTSQQLSDKSLKELPEFVSLDLLSPYILGKKKKIYKTEIEEELSTMVDIQEDRQVETYDDEVTKVKAAAGDLSLVHVLGYQSILQRLCCNSTLHPSSTSDGEGSDKGAGSLIGFDLGFISHAHMYSGLNSDVVRTMMRSSHWAMRLTHLHSFLSHHVPVYASTCCAVYPPDALDLPLAPNASATELSLICYSYSDHVLEKVSSVDLPITDSNTSQDTPSMKRTPPPPGSRTDVVKPLDKGVLSSVETELSVQWYQPTLEENELPDGPQSRKRLMLLYAISKKGGNSSAVQTGQLWVSLPDLLDLHDRLAVLSQKGEISLVDKPKKDISTPTPTPSPSKAKKAQRIKALSPKVQRDEHLENLLKQCVDDCCCLLGGQIPEAGTDVAVSETSVPEFPFEVTKSNLKNFEMLFDPSFGMTLRGGDLMAWMIKQFPA